MAITKGLEFRRMDLHVHTPSSSDYQDGDRTADEIVSYALAKELAAIAVTDHQTADAVDAIKEAGAKKGLVVFPAVELMVPGGKSGLHINLIFDVDKTASFIGQFLNRIKVYKDDRGKPSLISQFTVSQVSRELQEYDPTAIIVLAHCHSSKGVTGDTQGEQRSEIFDKYTRNILGAEASETDFLHEERRKKHTRVFDVLDGTDPNYHNRKLGVYQASDSHTLDGIGSSYSWFKVDDPITIEGLRQCLIDRDTRIRQPHEYAPTAYPRVLSMCITSGFLKDQAFAFHSGLNSLLGAKGSGKSLAIEALRFALDQSPVLLPIREDHWSKLEKCVKPYGQVEVRIVDESGKTYKITRTLQASTNHPIEIIDETDGTKKTFSLPEVFPVLFLSQNEIIKVAEEPSGGSLRGFIDRFFDFHHYQHKITEVVQELEQVDRRVAEALRSHLSCAEDGKKGATLKEEIAKLDRQLSNATFDTYKRNEAIGQGIKQQIENIDGLDNELADLEADYSSRFLIGPEDKAVSEDAGFKRALAASNRSYQLVAEQLKQARERVKAQRTVADGEYQQWQGQFTPIKQAYENLVKESGGTQVALDQRRRKLVADLGAIDRRMQATTAKAKGLRAAVEQRNGVLDRLDAAYKEYFDERSRRCAFFTEQSNGAISVTMAQGGDTSDFRAKLLGVKRGSYLKEDVVDQLVKAITPRALISAALRFEVKNRSDRKPIEELAASSGMRVDVLEKLIIHMLDEMPYEELLALMYSTAPQDVPQVSYKVGDTLKPLTELSVGQKAAALLIIGLSDGRFPIMIDQPEDSLDLRSIWDDVCETLRDSKERRQFIFTTHNSSVAVASDSDMFTILEAEATYARIVHAGSMNSKQVRDEVIAYLEGGHPTYEKKRAKYNLDHHSRPSS